MSDEQPKNREAEEEKLPEEGLSEASLEEETPEVDPIVALHDNWSSLDTEERLAAFLELARTDAEELFFLLTPAEQAELVLALSPAQQRSWMRLLPPDDVADLIQQVSDSERYQLISLLDESTRREVTALLAYAEDHAGGLMSSRFIRLRPDMSVEEAIRYLRAQAKTQVESIYYCYVLDSEQKLLGTVSFRELFLAPPDRRVNELMNSELVMVPEDMDQEEVSRLFSKYSLMALPVVDAGNHMKGIITVDDVVDVVKEEATEDIQKLGGTQALEAPYLATGLFEMLRKRGGWLTVLFVGELLTASAMDRYQHDLERAVVLALFIPLIISSGGNSGSQASTLIIRALALGEIRLRDWWRIFTREIVTGLALGAILGTLGLMRILVWPGRETLYGEHYILVGVTVSLSLVGVTLWGSVSGSMLPFLLRGLGFDPASASAPAVATLVDVTGLVIYFSLAKLLLSGTLL